MSEYVHHALIQISSHRSAQAKEYDVFDTSPFLRSKLFATNGYKVRDGVIEKMFRTD
jgi:DNA replication licensing factor MCM2